MKSALLFLVPTLLLLTCQQKDRGANMSPQEMEDRLVEINKQMLIDEDASIDRFVKSNEWPVTKTGTGLRYWIYEDADGAKAEAEQTAEVRFQVTLLDGSAVYATEGQETKVFRIEYADVESGLHEGIQLMSVGDKAKFILPSYLAHGLAGDLNKIPVKSPIIYDVELVSLQ